MAGETQSTSEIQEAIYALLSRSAATLGVRAERSVVDFDSITEFDEPEVDLRRLLPPAALQLGLAVRETSVSRDSELTDLVAEGFPVVIIGESGDLHLLRRPVGSRFEMQSFQAGQLTTTAMIGRREIGSRFVGDHGFSFLVIKRLLDCESMSSTPAYSQAEHGKHLSPFRRFLALLRMDARDIWTVALFALVSGVLSLATPLAVESLVNVVSWGIYLQPLLVLAIILLGCLGISATLTVLQTIVVEIIQRRQLVRIVSDLAHRFPRASREYLEGEYPRELANRVFDIMTIQKASATLLLDGMSIVLTTVLGLLLLAFYHPFLLGFDIVLLICMISMTWLLGRGGIRTAILESKTKYRIAHWLQDVLASPGSFRVNGGESLSIDRASALASDYVQARKQQFRVVLRQVIFATGIQVVASTALLGLGGWLVIQGQLTLGQLVASELVVTVVVGAFSKAGKSLEKFYDLMAGIDKVGHLLDIPTEVHETVACPKDRALSVSWDNLVLEDGNDSFQIPAGEINSGASVVLFDDERASLFFRAMVGLVDPVRGQVEIEGVEAGRLTLGSQGQIIGWASDTEVFHGTIRDNIALGRSGIGKQKVRDVLEFVQLGNVVSKLPEGVDTKLQTDGYPMSRSQLRKLMLARAIVGQPRLLLVDHVLDGLKPDEQKVLVESIEATFEKMTLVLATRNEYLAGLFQQKLELSR